MPREEPGATWQPSPQRDRSVVHQRACEDSKQFRDSLLTFLRAHHLMGAVKGMTESGSLPMVTLYCTLGVLEQLQRSPLFEAGRAMSLEMYT